MFCWKAEFRAGPPGCSDDEFILSGWFETLERAKADAIKNSGVQVFSYPFLRYSQYRLSFIHKEDGIERRLGEPEFFTFPFNSGSMLVYPWSNQVKVAKAPMAESPKQDITKDVQYVKQPQAVADYANKADRSTATKDLQGAVKESATILGRSTATRKAPRVGDEPKITSRIGSKRKREGNLPGPKRGRPKGSKNKPKTVETTG